MTSAEVWTPKTLLDWTEEFFGGKGIPTPRLDAELLLAHVLGCERIDLYLQFDRPLGPDLLTAFRELVRQRAARRPLAYLTGETGFWNLTLRVREGVLIPSPDSETLVEGLLAALGESRAAFPETPLRVLELGTGSGALPLAVCSEARDIRWLATEYSPAALAVAAENLRLNESVIAPRGNAVYLVRTDRFEAISPSWRPHIVAGNPPYIPTGTIDRLMPEVSRAEPRLALDGGADGGDFQRYMLDFAARNLPPGGRVLLEIGAEQSPALKQRLEAMEELRLVEFRKDLGGHPRVLHAEKIQPGSQAGP